MPRRAAATSVAYDPTIANIMMTLSGIAYVGEDSGQLSQIKTNIIAELATLGYATKRQWGLVWGPVIFKGTDNLIYVVRQGVSTYAIVMRGTVPDFASAWEDIPTSQADFSVHSGAGAMVSAPFLNALAGMVAQREKPSKLTLLQFLLNTIAKTPGATIYVTGHSQGGGLAPMMLGWLTRAAKTWKTRLIGYSFAGPTSGNPAFAQWIDNNATLFRVVNPLDVVPYGYAAIGDIIPNNIPTKVTNPGDKLCLDETLWTIGQMLYWFVGAWAQPSSQQTLPAKPAPARLNLLDQVGQQHHINSYLYLLGAPQLGFAPKSLL